MLLLSTYKAARVHHAARWRGCRVATRGAGATSWARAVDRAADGSGRRSGRTGPSNSA